MALTRDDIREVMEGVVKEEVREVVKEVVKEVVTQEVERIVDEKTKHLPTREEFFNSMDKLMGEVKNNREENEILNGRTSHHEQRIDALEKIHPQGQHSVI